MYDIKNLNIWKKDSFSQRQLTNNSIKILIGLNDNFPVYLGHEFMEADIVMLGLSVRSYNGLRRTGIEKVGDIVNKIDGVQDLGRIRNIGKTSVNEIFDKLIAYNQSFLTAGERIIYNKKYNEINRIINGNESLEKDTVISVNFDRCGLKQTALLTEAVELLKDSTYKGEYARTKKLFNDYGIDIGDIRVGVFHFTKYAELLVDDIENLYLGNRSYNALKRAGISKIYEIQSSIMLKSLKNLGDNSVKEIMDKVFVYHYYKINKDLRYKYLNRVKDIN